MISLTISAPIYLIREFLMIFSIQLQSPHGASKILLILYFFITFFSFFLKLTVVFKVEPGPDTVSELSQ